MLTSLACSHTCAQGGGNPNEETQGSCYSGHFFLSQQSKACSSLTSRSCLATQPCWSLLSHRLLSLQSWSSSKRLGNYMNSSLASLNPKAPELPPWRGGTPRDLLLGLVLCISKWSVTNEHEEEVHHKLFLKLLFLSLISRLFTSCLFSLFSQISLCSNSVIMNLTNQSQGCPGTHDRNTKSKTLIQ